MQRCWLILILIFILFLLGDHRTQFQSSVSLLDHRYVPLYFFLLWDSGPVQKYQDIFESPIKFFFADSKLSTSTRIRIQLQFTRPHVYLDPLSVPQLICKAIFIKLMRKFCGQSSLIPVSLKKWHYVILHFTGNSFYYRSRTASDVTCESNLALADE